MIEIEDRECKHKAQSELAYAIINQRMITPLFIGSARKGGTFYRYGFRDVKPNHNHNRNRVIELALMLCVRGYLTKPVYKDTRLDPRQIRRITEGL